MHKNTFSGILFVPCVDKLLLNSLLSATTVAPRSSMKSCLFDRCVRSGDFKRLTPPTLWAGQLNFSINFEDDVCIIL